MKEWIEKIIIFILIAAVIFGTILIENENKRLRKENARLQQQVFDYKWQLEQVEWFFKTME